MEQLFAAFDFLAGGLGLLMVAVSAAFIVLLWDWRAALAGLFLIQLGLAILAVRVHSVPAQWAGLQLSVTLLAIGMLAMSAQQATRVRSLHQAGNWLVRLLALVLLTLAWRVVEVAIVLPAFGPSMTALFGWLALCVLLILGLSDNPFFSGVALLLWTISAQILLAVLIPSANLFALIGGLSLLIALACSYLVLLNSVPGGLGAPIATDIVFPDDEYMRPANPITDDDEMLIDTTPLPGFLQSIFAVAAGELEAATPSSADKPGAQSSPESAISGKAGG